MPSFNPSEFDITQLRIDQRIALAQDLWDSIHADAHAAPFTPEQLEEIDRRLAAADAGAAADIPWEIVRREMSRQS